MGESYENHASGTKGEGLNVFITARYRLVGVVAEGSYSGRKLQPFSALGVVSSQVDTSEGVVDDLGGPGPPDLPILSWKVLESPGWRCDCIL